MKDLIYDDEDYMIFKKDLEVSGSLISGLELISIGLMMTEENQEWKVFKNEDDYIQILDRIISNVKRMKKKIKKWSKLN